jgi:hypothetical protein
MSVPDFPKRLFLLNVGRFSPAPNHVGDGNGSSKTHTIWYLHVSRILLNDYWYMRKSSSKCTPSTWVPAVRVSAVH